jgi:hypothetical protein
VVTNPCRAAEMVQEGRVEIAGLSFGDNASATILKTGIGGACTSPISINSRVYRTRFLLTRAKISFCFSDARFNTFE